MSTAWISIPPFAEPGQLHAFADREQQLASLYLPLVQAGNAVRKGQAQVRHRHVVYGYMGVGKSALVQQVLAMIRPSERGETGQQLQVPAGLPEPRDRQRWIVLRVSGKHVSNLDAFADVLATTIRKEEGAARRERDDPGATDALIPAFAEIFAQAEQAAPQTLDLPILNRLLRDDDARLYEAVRAALRRLADGILDVQRYGGGIEKRSRTESRSSNLDADLALSGGTSVGPEQASARLAAKLAAKAGRSFKEDSLLEGQWRISATHLVERLNAFFTQTNRARLPTILVLDDFDEVASSIGPSYQDRFKVLSWILGTFNQLCPTSLIVALRAEYMHEDIRRQFPHQTPVPPMSRDAARDAVEAWIDVLPGLGEGDKEVVRSAASRVLRHFPADRNLIVPFRFLPVVQWLATSPPHPLTEDGDLLERYVRQQYLPHEVDALLRAAKDMPEQDIERCAATHPVDPGPYGLTDRDREALEKAGLLRPALAGDPHERSVILDPLCAYLRIMSAGP